MISNLLTSLLIATAVGGTTATAFGNKPRAAEQSIITTRTNVIDETWDDEAFYDWGENGPLYTQQSNYTNSSNQAAILTQKGYYKGAGYQSSVYDIENRTYIQNTEIATSIPDYVSDDDIYIYKYLSITKLNIYVDVQQLEISQPMQVNMSILHDQDLETILDSESIVRGYIWGWEGQQSYLDNLLVGQTPPSTMYRYNGLTDAVSNMKADTSKTTLYNQQLNINDDDAYIGSDNLDMDATWNTIMRTVYYVSYVEWLYSEVSYTQTGQGRPEYYINPDLVRLNNNCDMTYTTNMIINSDGTATPEVVYVEPIDIPSVMYTVLTMPFAFVSQAFNLTIFAGTPYEINFAGILLGILAILIGLLVAKIIIRFIK